MASYGLAARFREAFTKTALRSYLAEFVSTFFFVLAAVGSAMSSRRLTLDAVAPQPAALALVALANAFALSYAVYVAGNISGGHLNPAVTFAMAIGGRITVPTAIFYWMSQLLASVMACVLLKSTTAGQVVPSYAIAEEMTGFGSSILEGIVTFALVYTVYAAGDPRNSPLGTTGPLMIGFVAGAGVLAAGPFSGGSMNPACAFGSALVAGSFKNQAVYWIGPLVGGMAAGLIYDNVMVASPAQDVGGLSEGVRV